MMNTVSSKILFLLLLLFLVTGSGCLFVSGNEKSLETLQAAVRERMLKLQSSELLAEAAQERYNPRKAAELLTMKEELLSRQWSVENDPGLQALEDAIVYALLATSSRPEKTAEKVTAARLDYGTALRLLKLKNADTGSSADIAAELAMMTNWSSEKIRTFIALPLPPVSTELFPLDPASEELLNKEGASASFRLATGLYRNPSYGAVLKAERLRRAILNRTLMQIKSPGAEMTPELYIAFRRSRLFSALLSL